MTASHEIATNAAYDGEVSQQSPRDEKIWMQQGSNGIANVLNEEKWCWSKYDTKKYDMFSCKFKIFIMFSFPKHAT